MKKTSLLGLPLPIVGIAMFLTCYFGGYVPALLLAGYILLKEDSRLLKQYAVAGILLMFTFSALSVIIGFLPDCLNLISDLLALFKVHFRLSFIYTIENLFYDVLALLKTVVFIGMAAVVIFSKNDSIPLIGKLMDKIVPAKETEQNA